MHDPNDDHRRRKMAQFLVVFYVCCALALGVSVTLTLLGVAELVLPTNPLVGWIAAGLVLFANVMCAPVLLAAMRARRSKAAPDSGPSVNGAFSVYMVVGLLAICADGSLLLLAAVCASVEVATQTALFAASIIADLVFLPLLVKELDKLSNDGKFLWADLLALPGICANIFVPVVTIFQPTIFRPSTGATLMAATACFRLLSLSWWSQLFLSIGERVLHKIEPVALSKNLNPRESPRAVLVAQVVVGSVFAVIITLTLFNLNLATPPAFTPLQLPPATNATNLTSQCSAIFVNSAARRPCASDATAVNVIIIAWNGLVIVARALLARLTSFKTTSGSSSQPAWNFSLSRIGESSAALSVVGAMWLIFWATDAVFCWRDRDLVTSIMVITAILSILTETVFLSFATSFSTMTLRKLRNVKNSTTRFLHSLLLHVQFFSNIGFACLSVVRLLGYNSTLALVPPMGLGVSLAFTVMSSRAYMSIKSMGSEIEQDRNGGPTVSSDGTPLLSYEED